jgi:hypothetical protein
MAPLMFPAGAIAEEIAGLLCDLLEGGYGLDLTVPDADLAAEVSGAALDPETYGRMLSLSEMAESFASRAEFYGTDRRDKFLNLAYPGNLREALRKNGEAA